MRTTALSLKVLTDAFIVSLLANIFIAGVLAITGSNIDATQLLLDTGWMFCGALGMAIYKEIWP